jgi:AcrR family transcriptional regulator
MQKSRQPAKPAPTPPRGRGRPRAFDRDTALGQAVQLFWRKGFEATSMADLTGAMGIGAPSLYAAFGSKEALYAEALRFYEKNYGGNTWGDFDSEPTARSAVQSLLMNSAASLTRCKADEPAGCMITLSSIDGDRHAGLCDAIRTSRSAVVDRLETRFKRAVSDGEIAAATDLHALARFVQTVQSGMSILARDGATRAELEAVTRVAMASWDALSPPKKAARR